MLYHPVKVTDSVLYTKCDGAEGAKNTSKPRSLSLQVVPYLSKVVYGRVASAVKSCHGENVLFSKTHEIDNGRSAGSFDFCSIGNLDRHPQSVYRR